MLSAVAFAPTKLPPHPDPLRSVLVIDETPQHLSTYSEVLSQEGYRVYACESSSQGAAFIQKRPFHAVIITESRPGFPWRSLLEQAIKADSIRPVLIITDCLDIDSYRDAVWLGAADYIERPSSSEQLLKAVQWLMRPLGNCA